MFDMLKLNADFKESFLYLVSCIYFILSKNQVYIIMQMILPFLIVTMTFTKPRMSSHPKVNMSLNGFVTLESSRLFSWIRGDMVTVRASHYRIITVKCEDSVKLLGVTIALHAEL